MNGSTLTALTIALISLHAVVFAIDEIFFHRKRGLGTFESWGHPVDSIVLAIALAVPAVATFSNANLTTYIILSVVSCLVITKDEWVHTAECSAGEHWLHSLLFVLHPLLLLSSGLLWREDIALWLRQLLPVTAALIAVSQFVVWVLFKGRIYGIRSASR